MSSPADPPGVAWHHNVAASSRDTKSLSACPELGSSFTLPLTAAAGSPAAPSTTPPPWPCVSPTRYLLVDCRSWEQRPAMVLVVRFALDRMG